MTNRNKTINQKEGIERNKEVWILKDPEGNIVGRYRQKQVVINEKAIKEKGAFGGKFTIERDRFYIDKLKENFNDKKRKV